MITQNPIDSETIFNATEIRTGTQSYSGVGDLYANHTTNIISYIARQELLKLLELNNHITGVFCTADLAPSIPSQVTAIICDDPTWSYFSLVDYLAGNQLHEPSCIAPSSTTNGTWIAQSGVQIAEHARLEPFASVYESTNIGAHTLIRSGAALGLDSFQHQRTSKGIISPRHDGSLHIAERVEIGANCSISKGFSYRDTVIEDDVKIDANVSIAHGVKIGSRSIVCAGVKILGHSVIGADTFIGPGAIIRNRVTIGDGARISIGSVVTQDVAAGETVTGNFAVPHEDWLAFVKNLSLAKDGA